MSNLDRILIAILATGIWTLAWTQWEEYPAQAMAQSLSRYDIANAVRDVLRENPPLNTTTLRATLSDTLSHCTITGRLTEGETAQADSTDFIAQIRC